MKKKKDNTLLEMLVGIIIWGILSQVALCIFFENYLYNAIGLWCGIVVAGGMAIHMKRLETIKARMNRILADNTGKSVEEVTAACERDNFMTSDEAMAFGLIDRVLDRH